jgi:hypothetical protein
MLNHPTKYSSLVGWTMAVITAALAKLGQKFITIAAMMVTRSFACLRTCL